MSTNSSKNRQIALFDAIKRKAGTDLHVVHELCKLLNITDSAVYKRMRGDKIINLQELTILEDYYALLTANKPRSERTPKLIFEYSNVGHKKYTPANQLKDIAKEMKRAKEDKAAIAYYIARHPFGVKYLPLQTS